MTYSLKGEYSQVRGGLSLQAEHTDRVRYHSLKLQRQRFGRDIWKTFLTEGAMGHWYWLPREAVQPPPLELFKERPDVTLGARSGYRGWCSSVGWIR